MTTCPNGHSGIEPSDRFCPICGAAAISETPAIVDPTVRESTQVVHSGSPISRPSRGRRSGLLVAAIVVVLAIVGGIAVAIVVPSDSTTATKDLIGVRRESATSGPDLYLVNDGQEPDAESRVGLARSVIPILPIDGPYEVGPDGPYSIGPAIVKFGSRTAVATVRRSDTEFVADLELIASDGTSTTVMSARSMPMQAAPLEVWYSKTPDVLLVESFDGTGGGSCSRVDPDGRVTEILRGSCRILPNGVIWSSKPKDGTTVSFEHPESNSFEVTLHDYQGAVLSTATIAGVSSVSPNATGERTIASSQKELRIYETRSGGLLIQANGAQRVSTSGWSRASDVSAYFVDNGDEQLGGVIVRADGSKLELGNFLRAGIQLSADGRFALLSSSPSTAAAGTYSIPGSTSSNPRYQVVVERIEIESGRRTSVAEGIDLQGGFYGWSDQVVIWGAGVDTIWSGPADGDLIAFDAPIAKKTGVSFLNGSKSLFIASGDGDAHRGDIITANGNLVSLDGEWTSISALASNHQTVVLVGRRGEYETLISWSEKNGSTELDFASSILHASFSGDSVMYQVNLATSKDPRYAIRRASLDGKQSVETVWSNATWESSPLWSSTVSSWPYQVLGSNIQTPYSDPVAKKCKERSEPVLEPGGSAVGTIGSTRVCIVVPATRNVTLTVTSTADTTMTVEDGSSKRMAYDDDSGYSSNPYISTTLTKGTYIVRIEPYGSSRNGGTFSLRYN